MNLEEKILPFIWHEHKEQVSVTLTVGNYKHEIFESRVHDGFEGNGYDWASLADIFLKEKLPHLLLIKFDPEGSMFCAYSDSREELKEFILAFKVACEDDALILDLFSRAVLD